LSANADGVGETFSIPPDHNRAEMIVGVPGTLTAGDVHLLRVAGNPSRETAAKGLAGTAAFNTRGGRVFVHVAPGARVQAELSGYAVSGGSAPVVAVLESWRD